MRVHRAIHATPDVPPRRISWRSLWSTVASPVSWSTSVAGPIFASRSEVEALVDRLQVAQFLGVRRQFLKAAGRRQESGLQRRDRRLVGLQDRAELVRGRPGMLAPGPRALVQLLALVLDDL